MKILPHQPTAAIAAIHQAAPSSRVRAAIVAALVRYRTDERQELPARDPWRAAALPWDRSAARAWRGAAWAEAERPW